MKKTRVIKINPIFIIIVVFIFICIIIKLFWVGLGNVKVGDVSLSDFASKRDIKKETLPARRGTIYSRNNEVLAKDVNSYTVIAYLEESRTTDIKNPHHVVDKEKTAELLSPLINMKKETILSLLNTMVETCNEDKTKCTKKAPYQVELGPGGRGITELLKEQIEKLELPGIDFIASTKRYYPKGEFLSYTLGYAKKVDNQYQGEMGLELYYNDELTGKNGYKEYQSDLYGYQITNRPSVEKKSIPGNDIYLTIDDNIQMFTESARRILDSSNPEWAVIAVVDAKTGEILGLSSSPGFNNNTLNIKSYYDPFVSYEFEPGSTMKTFSFMAAIENGVYNGDEKYKSGSIKVDNATIKDWNSYGFGQITYDQGYMASSNVAAVNLALKLKRSKLKDFYSNLGLGKKTGISLPNEAKGTVDFKYDTELASASYGQGITINANQMIQALTAITNKGTVIKPYIVSKIVDSNTGEIILENKRTELKKVASEETINKIIEIMRSVVQSKSYLATGTGYDVPGYDLIGKTGTAEIASPYGGYLKGSRNYIRSFTGIFPGKDPQVIVYALASKMANSNDLNKAVKSLVKSVGTYLNINGNTNVDEDKVFKVQNYINKETKEIKEVLSNSKMQAVVIGDGEKIINQYPKSGTKLNLDNKVFLLTSAKEFKMLDITSWSRNDVSTYASLIGLKTKFNGFGYVKEYSIKSGSVIDKNKELEVLLEPKYKTEEKNDKTNNSTN